MSSASQTLALPVMGSLIILVYKRADWNVPVSYIKYMSPCSACGFSTNEYKIRKWPVLKFHGSGHLQIILHLNKITECFKMTTFKIVFTFDVLISAETTCTARWHVFYIRNRHISVSSFVYKYDQWPLLSSRYMFSYHPFYFDFHSAHVIFDVSSGFYFWNVNRTPTWHRQVDGFLRVLRFPPPIELTATI
jgi:hypothetical protein